MKEKTLRKRISLSVITLLVMTGICAVFFSYGCGEEDPAQAMLKSQGAPASSAKSPAAPGATADAGKGAAPSPAGKPEAAPASGDGKGGIAPAGGKAGTGGAAASTPPTAGAPADKPGAKDEAKDKADAAKDDKAAKPGDKKKAGDGELSEDERIVNFQNLDPRDIIIKKYDSLAQLHTEPWNPEKNEDDFIPETGRIDPLNPVDSAIPDELKPPRSGETDQNLIETYLVSVACTAAVDSVRQMVQVYNVLKIGAQKYVSIGIGGQRGSIEVGQGFGFMAGSVGNIPILVNLTISSATESEVVIDVTASGAGTATSVSKSQVFIPRSFTG